MSSTEKTEPLPHIGVRLPSWAGFASQIWEGLHEAATIAGGWRYEIDGRKSMGEVPKISLDHTWTGEGMITFRLEEQEAKAWKSSGVPVVNLSSEGPSPGIPRVIPNNIQAGKIAAKHLAENGLPNFSFLGRETTLHRDHLWASGMKRVYSEDRKKGFVDYLHEAGHSPHSHNLSGHALWKKNSWKAVRAEIKTFLASLPLPCGIFAADDQLAIVVIQAARELDLDIPHQISVLGFGNDPELCFTASPPLSTVAYPGQSIGFNAAQTLKNLMAGKHVPLVVQVPVTNVMERGSSAFFPTEDSDVSRLLNYIRKRAPSHPLRVAELIEISPWGITTLKKKMRKVLGHGPKEEIKRVRVRRLKELLSNTDMSISEISQIMGFGSHQDMSRFLLRESGFSPTDFRVRTKQRS